MTFAGYTLLIQLNAKLDNATDDGNDVGNDVSRSHHSCLV
jgi:hypothetical protein